MAQKRLHFLLLLSIPWVALYARCVEAFDCSSSWSTDEICFEGDDLISTWIPRLNCSVPNEITLRYTDERNRTVLRFSHDVLLNGEELRLECHNNGSRATCISNGFNEADVIGGTYTFSNLNETGIFPGWTCMVKGCFSAAEDAYYRTPPVSCTLSPDQTRAPTSVAATMSTGEDKTSNLSTTDNVPHISKDPKMSDSDMIAIWPFIWAGSAGGGLLLLLILVASFFIVVYLIQQKKRRASRCNISTDVAYSTTERSDSCVNLGCYSNDYENVPAHTKLNADNKSSEPVLQDIIVYPVPNFEEHQFPASATHTNAAYASSQSPLVTELEPVYNTVLPDIQQTSESEKH